MITCDINVEGLSKIEGHVNLHVKVRNNRVTETKFMIAENRRFYEEAVRGKPINAGPVLMSRICGTCSIAHLMCDIKAIENALGVNPSRQTMLLRELSMHGLMIRDHALHVYFFSLPDIFGRDSILEFDAGNKQERKLLQDSFDIKRVGNNLTKVVAGRAVHATLPVIGGFTKIPEPGELNPLIAQLKKIREQVLDIVDIYARWDKSLINKTADACLLNKNFDYLTGPITTGKKKIKESDFITHLQEKVQPYTTSKSYTLDKELYMVGSVSRLNLIKKNLHKDTKKDTPLKLFPSYNVFHNTLAQAIEIVHSIDRSIEILESTDFKPETPVRPAKVTGQGIGVVEAPRGLLYHYIDIKDSKIQKSKVIVPTSQNQIKMEKELGMLTENLLSNHTKVQITYELEQLIRAYDPCMSCASHFLKVNWDKDGS